MDDNERIPLVVGKEKQIPFDASEAGPGELTADVRGPTTTIPTAVETRPGGRHTLVFTPEEEGTFVYLSSAPLPPPKIKQKTKQCTNKHYTKPNHEMKTLKEIKLTDFHHDIIDRT